jgi:predicted PhzF superfamily epimerase YddE/YHI9
MVSEARREKRSYYMVSRSGVTKAHQARLRSMKNSETTGKIMGVIVTLKGTPDNGCVSKEGEMYDFVTRFFCPWYGIAEDPVTGKNRCVLKLTI